MLANELEAPRMIGKCLKRLQFLEQTHKVKCAYRLSEAHGIDVLCVFIECSFMLIYFRVGLLTATFKYPARPI